MLNTFKASTKKSALKKNSISLSSVRAHETALHLQGSFLPLETLLYFPTTLVNLHVGVLLYA